MSTRTPGPTARLSRSTIDSLHKPSNGIASSSTDRPRASRLRQRRGIPIIRSIPPADTGAATNPHVTSTSKCLRPLDQDGRRRLARMVPLPPHRIVRLDLQPQVGIAPSTPARAIRRLRLLEPRPRLAARRAPSGDTAPLLRRIWESSAGDWAERALRKTERTFSTGVPRATITVKKVTRSWWQK